MRHFHLHYLSVYEGHDGIARFTVAYHSLAVADIKCDYCLKYTKVTLKYRDEIEVRLMDRWGLPISKTMLKHKRAALCPACWSKMQRQFTHIAESGARKGLNAP